MTRRCRAVLYLFPILVLACAGNGSDANRSERSMFNSSNQRWGYIARNGELVIEPQFNEAFEFFEGLSRVSTNDKTGYVDKAGMAVISPQYELAGEFSEVI